MRWLLGSLLFFCFCLLNIGSVYAWDIAYPSPGVYSIRPKCAPSGELSTVGLGKSNGVNVVLMPISSNNIKWRIARVGNTEWYTISVDGTNIGLNVDNGRNVSGTNVTLWETKGAWQQFRFWDVGGGYYLIQGHVGGTQAMVLDVAGGGNNPNANVWSYGHNNSDAQLWKLVNVNAQPPTNTQTTQTGYINTQSKNLNLRNAPNGSIIGKLAKNTIVTILQGNVNGWTKVRTNSGQEGYVSSQYVAIGTPSTTTNTPTTQTGYINTQSKNLNLRNAPNGSIIGKLAKGTRVTIVQGDSNGWTRVRTNSGQEGYVSSQYVAIDGNTPSGGDTINHNTDIYSHLERLANSISGYRMGTRYNGDGQCRGFANKVYLATFPGVSYISGYANRNYSASSFSGSYEAGRLFNFSSNDTASVKRLFQSVKIGAFVQMGRRGKLNSTGTAQAPHSAIVYNIMEDGVQFFEANTDGKNTIKVGTYSWQDLANKNQGFTIYMPNNYTLK